MRSRESYGRRSSRVADVEATSLERTPLYSRHVSLGARMVPFAGYEMPVQYRGVIEEHRAVRTDAGAFDVSHMGEIHVDGPTAGAFLQQMLSNDIDRLGDGESQYTLLTNEEGGIVDDLIAYRLAHGQYLVVVNASNRHAVYDWLKEREPRGTRGARRLGRVRARRRAGAALARAARAAGRAGVHARNGRGRRGGGDDLPHRLHGRDGRRALRRRGRRRGALGRRARARRRAVRARRARHAAARGLLPAPRKRHHSRDRRDLRRARLGVRARDRVHGSRGAAAHQGSGAGPQARPVRDGGEGGPAAGNDDRGRRRGDLGHALADARPRHRHGLRPRGERLRRHRAHDRRPREAAVARAS